MKKRIANGYGRFCDGVALLIALLFISIIMMLSLAGAAAALKLLLHVVRA